MMNPPPTLPDKGLVHDIYDIGKRGHFESQKKGQPEPTFKLVMGAALVWIGAEMLLEAWNKMHGGRGR